MPETPTLLSDRIEWREQFGELKPFLDGKPLIWAAQPGAQHSFLSCPVFEALITGSRGGGKTDCLLMDFAQHIGQGFGAEWRGILFRQTYPELADVIAKSKKWFNQLFPGAKFNESMSRWVFPGGEELLLRHMASPDDYWHYHGHAYPWIAFEELTTWADDRCYKLMMSCCRSTNSRVPRKIRSSTNPYGIGHNWVKSRFHLPVPYGRNAGSIIKEKDPETAEALPFRVAINCPTNENRVLMKNDPHYMSKVRAAATSPAQARAWVEGDWDIVAGGMLDDVWNRRFHVIPSIPFERVPATWRIDRSYDHGQSRPFSVGWWAESNGEPLDLGGRKIGVVPGDLIRIAEWYGWKGTPNEGLRMSASDIALGIIQRERAWNIAGRVRPGPADTSIFDDFEPGRSVAGDMAKYRVFFTRADKSTGSRIQGWQQIRKYLADAIPTEGFRERPGLFICENCSQFLRTVPVLPRDERNPDDVDTDAEDHIGDEVRYRIRVRRSVSASTSWK